MLPGSLFGHPTAPGASEGVNPEGGGGAGAYSEPNAATATANPHC